MVTTRSGQNLGDMAEQAAPLGEFAELKTMLGQLITLQTRQLEAQTEASTVSSQVAKSGGKVLAGSKKALTLLGEKLAFYPQRRRQEFPELWERLRSVLSEEPMWVNVQKALEGETIEIEPEVDRLFSILLKHCVSGPALDQVRSMESIQTRDGLSSSGVKLFFSLREWALPRTMLDMLQAVMRLLNFQGREMPSKGEPTTCMNKWSQEVRDWQTTYGLDIPDYLLVAVVLDNLPKEYNQLRYDLSKLGCAEVPKVDELVNRISAFWAGNIQDKGSSTDHDGGADADLRAEVAELKTLLAAAMAAKADNTVAAAAGGPVKERQSEQHQTEQTFRKKDGCYKCGANGHIARDCPEKGGRKEPKAESGVEKTKQPWPKRVPPWAKNKAGALAFPTCDTETTPGYYGLAVKRDENHGHARLPGDHVTPSIEDVECGIGRNIQMMMEAVGSLSEQVASLKVMASEAKASADQARTHSRRVKSELHPTVKSAVDENDATARVPVAVVAAKVAKGKANGRPRSNPVGSKRAGSTEKGGRAADAVAVPGVAFTRKTRRAAAVETTDGGASKKAKNGELPRAILDSGASHVIFNDKRYFVSWADEPGKHEPTSWKSASGGEMYSEGRGIVEYWVQDELTGEAVAIQVLGYYVPAAPFNLAGVFAFEKQNDLLTDLGGRRMTGADGAVQVRIRVRDDTYSLEECAPGPPSARRIRTKEGNAHSSSKALASKRDSRGRMLDNEIVSRLATGLLGEPQFGADVNSSEENEHSGVYFTVRNVAHEQTWIDGDFWGNPPFEAVRAFLVSSYLSTTPAETAGGERVPLGPTRWPVVVLRPAASMGSVVLISNDMLAHISAVGDCADWMLLRCAPPRSIRVLVEAVDSEHDEATGVLQAASKADGGEGTRVLQVIQTDNALEFLGNELVAWCKDHNTMNLEDSEQADIHGNINRRKLADRVKKLAYIGQAEVSNGYRLVDMDNPATIIRAGVVTFDETSVVANCSRHVADQMKGKQRDYMSSDFNVAKPEGNMLEVAIDEKFVVLEHRGMFHKEDKETYAIFRVKSKAHPHGIWTLAQMLLEDCHKNVAVVAEYLSKALTPGCVNPFYPLFTVCEMKWEGVTSSRRPMRQSAQKVEWIQCLVVGITHYKSDIDIQVITMDGAADLLDVARATLRVPAKPTIALAATEVGWASKDQPASKPKSIRQALRAHDAEEWIMSMDKEITQMVDKGTFSFLELEEIPEGAKPIPMSMKFDVKHEKNGASKERKSRLAADGSHQTYTVDYEDTFAPASQLVSVRTILTPAVCLELKVFHADVSGAFLNAELNAYVYVKLPEALPESTKATLPSLYAKLVRSSYGLKQVANDWRKCQDNLIMEVPGMQKSAVDPCWYFIQHKELVVHILVHVDDYIIATNSEAWKDWFVNEYYASRYKIRDLGILDHVVGIGVTWGDNCVALTRTHDILETLKKHGLLDAKSLTYPIAKGFTLAKAEVCDKTQKFLNLSGDLRYHERACRPDMSLMLAKLSPYGSAYDQRHMDALKDGARYMKGTADMPFFIRKNSKTKVESFRLFLFTDATWNSELDGKSMSGWVLYLNGNNVASASKRQDTVARSSTEAEVIAVSEGAKDLFHVYQLLDQLVRIELPMTIMIDNQATIALLENPVNNKRSKHMWVRYMWVREQVQKGLVRLQYVKTEENVADYLTKPLSGEKFNYFRAQLMGHI